MLSRTARHLAPSRTLTARASRHPTPLQQLQRPRARFSSSSPAPGGQEAPSPNAQFWKTFGRPIAKVLLVAVFTYQLAYYGWVRLEQDETRAKIRGTRALPLPLPLPVTPQS
ncbi:hypothetical protein F5Y00DRAFT_191480 [Daldinia vernicosa]|uniref:uncharacterized protein n=1 Tax=Daldinia vernicosa TaxID=114800 RepID=UPI002007F322|nr:uncharacterized protein F5Y00DRAFT_191480 [Daldinia vernicosa]KAI0852228.1 hypothetical protein F5Y00DRAFT_191480 [Daldinia vernicosa]